MAISKQAYIALSPGLTVLFEIPISFVMALYLRLIAAKAKKNNAFI